ncbi:Aste57867_16186 [Aphanomyces stellatus]|uniref:Aste57867_16186 protein n=1 Tax=Aphanomyces stellatus TaxID=120398 RepID=A0A485L5T8_9STRA|nr:hypothetical protein As57867_016130 [Aphanomyces stellatus]VFT92964.1 Aste57867_16186 [Aphanomyces stellatus]
MTSPKITALAALLPQKPVKHSRRTDHIMRLLRSAFHDQFKFMTGKAFVVLALKIEGLLNHQFPNDVHIVLSSDALQAKLVHVVRHLLGDKLKPEPTHVVVVALPSKFSIASMLN